jgi:hypothetical protein
VIATSNFPFHQRFAVEREQIRVEIVFKKSLHVLWCYSQVNHYMRQNSQSRGAARSFVADGLWSAE